MSKKKMIGIGAGIGIGLVVLAGGIYLVNDGKQTVVENPVEESLIATYAMSYTNNGIVSIYETKEGKHIADFDLKTLSTKKEVVEVVETIPAPAPKPITPTEETYKDFVKVPVVIKKGDTSWGIQENLTPNRKTYTMLKLVQELNAGKKLHPIYPGETRIYLKEKGKEVTTPTPIPSPVQKIEKKVEKQIGSNATYIYFSDLDQKALYAYSDFDKAVYKITALNGNIEAKEVYQNDQFVTAEALYVTDKHVLILEKGTDKFQLFPITNPNQVKVVKAEGDIDQWLVKDEALFYTFGNRLGKYNLSTGEQTSVLMGDKSLDMTAVKDKVYVLNSFGKETTNSLLMQVNPSDLKVDNLTELNSNETALLSKGDTENLYVGRVEKEKDLSDQVVKEPVISPINLANMSIEPSKWTMPFTHEGMGYQSHFYMLKDGKIGIYRMGEKDPVEEFSIKGDHFTLIP